MGESTMNRERRDFVKGAGMAVAAAAVAGQVGPAAAQPKPAYEIYAAKYAGPFITDLIAWMETYDKVRAKASAVDLCFPGHDAGMLLNYPKVAEDVTRLA